MAAELALLLFILATARAMVHRGSSNLGEIK